METDRAKELLAGQGLKETPGRLANLAMAPANASLVLCGDESTGCRFGDRKCRAGRAIKIGRKNQGRAGGWQIWAVW